MEETMKRIGSGKQGNIYSKELGLELVAIKVYELAESTLDWMAREEECLTHLHGGEWFPKLIADENTKPGLLKHSVMMELRPGLSLDREQIGAEDLMVFIRQLFLAMDFMARSMVAHRDIKPSNVMWCTKTKKLTIVDFAFGLVIRKADDLIGPAGTINYMAPEALTTSPAIRLIGADVYSAGVMLYWLLTRTLPIVLIPGLDRSKYSAIKLLHPLPKQRDIPGVPDEVWRLTFAMLEPDYEKRITIAMLVLLSAPKV